MWRNSSLVLHLFGTDEKFEALCCLSGTNVYIREPDRQCTYNVTLRHVHTTIVVVEKQWVLYTVNCVSVALVIQHAMRMPHIVICGLSGYTIFFSHYLINGTIFGKKKVTEHKICFLLFSTTFVWNIFHSKNKWARYDKKMYIGLQVPNIVSF